MHEKKKRIEAQKELMVFFQGSNFLNIILII